MINTTTKEEKMETMSEARIEKKAMETDNRGIAVSVKVVNGPRQGDILNLRNSDDHPGRVYEVEGENTTVRSTSDGKFRLFEGRNNSIGEVEQI